MEKTLLYGALLVGVGEQGPGTEWEVGESKEERARPPWGVEIW